MQSACCFCICSTHVQFNKLNDMKYEISCCFCFVQHNTKDTGTCYWMILINKCYWRSIFFYYFHIYILSFSVCCFHCHQIRAVCRSFVILWRHGDVPALTCGSANSPGVLTSPAYAFLQIRVCERSRLAFVPRTAA